LPRFADTVPLTPPPSLLLTSFRLSDSSTESSLKLEFADGFVAVTERLGRLPVAPLLPLPSVESRQWPLAPGGDPSVAPRAVAPGAETLSRPRGSPS